MAANDSNSTAQNAYGNVSTEHTIIFSAIAFLKGKKKTELTLATFVSLNRQLAERGFCTWQSQQNTVVEWIRQCSKDPRDPRVWKFHIPFLLDETHAQYDFSDLWKATICHNSLLDIIVKGRDFWTACQKHYKEGTTSIHKGTGQMSNKKRKFLEDFEETLEEHFEELQREAEPIATRYVREVTGEATLRDGEDGLIYLPPFFTVRKCYAQYCYQKRGVIITTSNKGNVRAAPAVDGEELNSFPSWKGYWTYWRDHYPNLKVRKPTRDICNFCYKFYNMHKFGPVESTSVAEGEDPTTIEEGVIETEDEDVHRELLAETDADLNAPVAVTTLAREREIAILDAVLHVKKAMAMRALVNSKIETSKKHRVQNVPHSDRVYTIIADFCQNMELPHFGQQQPGETYFLTPVKLEGFGVADVSYEWKDGKETDHLYFHCFVEGHGAKGGSNVASMIVKTLRKTKIMRDDDNGAPVRGKELNIVMDNCAGQNKNNYVLLLAPYLVEAGYFFTVNMLFLIAGHTKNVCDRRFNDLKRDYHKSQVFTIDDAVEVFNASEYVTVCQIDPENDWKNYADFLQQPYVLLAKANLSIVNNHIFCAEWTPSTDPLATSSGGSLTFYTRESALEEHVRKYGVITKATFAAGGNRTETLRSMAPESINYKGLPGYKQILMYNSFREYVPMKCRNDPLYRKPPQTVFDAEKKDQRERRDKKKKKSRQLPPTK